MHTYSYSRYYNFNENDSGALLLICRERDMTVCVGLAVNDCLVFAADSASSIVQTTVDSEGNRTTGVINVYENGDKVYNLYRGLPICAMTCGMGNIGSASIGTLVKKLRKSLETNSCSDFDKENYNLEGVAKLTRDFFWDTYQKADNRSPDSSFEFWVGGYSSDENSSHEVWKIKIENDSCDDSPEKITDNGSASLFFGGQPLPIHRLIFGVDPNFEAYLCSIGFKKEDAYRLGTDIRNHFSSELFINSMPVKDAIDLATYLVDLTKSYFRFSPGADIVGGETDVAVVTRYEGFKWIKRKYFYSRELNRLETGHV